MALRQFPELGGGAISVTNFLAPRGKCRWKMNCFEPLFILLLSWLHLSEESNGLYEWPTKNLETHRRPRRKWSLASQQDAFLVGP